MRRALSESQSATWGLPGSAEVSVKPGTAHGDFEALLALLDPDVVLRSDGGVARPRLTVVVHGARAVAEQAVTFARLFPYLRTALVNGAAGVVVARHGRPFSVMGFTVAGGKILEIDILTDPARLVQLDLAVVDE